LMNLSKATRECKNLQRYMREVMNELVVNEYEDYVRGGKTQLNYFCEIGMTSSVVRMLEMRSINVEAKGVYGRTCLPTAANNGHLDICRLLINKGALLEAKDSEGFTSLHLAADRGLVNICRLLIDEGAQLDEKTNYGSTPLHYVSYEGHVEIVRLLCDRGANIEAQDEEGLRPLHDAASNGHISVVKELIEERNAEINARTVNGETALTFANNYNKLDVAAYLVSHGGLV